MTAPGAVGRKLTTWIECSDGDMVTGLVCSEPQDESLDEQHARMQWASEAAKSCRCDLMWSPCEGVLAGGVCDEIAEDEYDCESWE